MPDFSAGALATGAGSTTLPMVSIYAAATGGGTIREISVYNTTTTLVDISVRRLTTAGTQGASVDEHGVGSRTAAAALHGGAGPFVQARRSPRFHPPLPDPWRDRQRCPVGVRRQGACDPGGHRPGDRGHARERHRPAVRRRVRLGGVGWRRPMSGLRPRFSVRRARPRPIRRGSSPETICSSSPVRRSGRSPTRRSLAGQRCSTRSSVAACGGGDGHAAAGDLQERQRARHGVGQRDRHPHRHGRRGRRADDRVARSLGQDPAVRLHVGVGHGRRRVRLDH